jgi:hypothetical protein
MKPTAVELVTRDFSMLTPPRVLEHLQKSGHLALR